MNLRLCLALQHWLTDWNDDMTFSDATDYVQSFCSLSSDICVLVINGFVSWVSDIALRTS
jgi:hypothetical protein